MLTRKERYIMEYLYQRCTGKNSCLINPREIITFASDRYIMYPQEIEKIVTNLVYDNYIEVDKSDKKGEMVYCVSLKLKGQGFHRELVNNKRTIMSAVGRTVILAILSFLITWILKILIF
jgi:DNA-binding MarR family transcriptional regulator